MVGKTTFQARVNGDERVSSMRGQCRDNRFSGESVGRAQQLPSLRHGAGGGNLRSLMQTLAILALAGWLLGFTWTVLNLLFLPRLRRVRGLRGPFVSVVIPARNEARTIERSMRAWL